MWLHAPGTGIFKVSTYPPGLSHHCSSSLAFRIAGKLGSKRRQELPVILWPQLRNCRTPFVIHSIGQGTLQGQPRFTGPNLTSWYERSIRIGIWRLWVVTFEDHLSKHPTLHIPQLQLVANRKKKSQHYSNKEGPIKANSKLGPFLSN